MQRNTFFLVLFDAFVDAMFGAVLPACMVADALVAFALNPRALRPKTRNPMTFQTKWMLPFLQKPKPESE